AIFTRRLWSGEAPTLYGFGRATRDYVHVADVVRALRLAEGRAGVYNVATGRETDVDTVFAHLQRAAATKVEPVREPLREGALEQYGDDGWELVSLSLDADLRGERNGHLLVFKRPRV